MTISSFSRIFVDSKNVSIFLFSKMFDDKFFFVKNDEIVDRSREFSTI